MDKDGTSGDLGHYPHQRGQPPEVRLHLCLTVSVLTILSSIIHKLIHKEKQYLRDLDTIETVCVPMFHL